MASKKRLPDQINRDRVRIAELKFKGYTDKEIASVIAEETGIALSRRQITYDMQRIREKWLKTQNDTYQALVARELERLDVTESALWRAMRESATDGRRLERTEISEGGTKDIKAVELSGANPAFFTPNNKGARRTAQAARFVCTAVDWY